MTLPTITQVVVDNLEYVPVVESRMIVYEPPILTISSCPVLVTTTPPITHNLNIHKERTFRMVDVQELLSVNCISIDDVNGSLFEWGKNNENINIQWNVTPICTRSFALFLFKSLNNEAQFKIITVPKLQAWITSSVPEINIFEASFIPDKDTICVE